MRWQTEIIDFTSGDVVLHGELLVPPGSGPFPGAVLCHGMGSDHRAMRPVAQKLVRQGIAALAFDFRGHGKSDGVVDDCIYHDVIAALRFLRGHTRINPKRIALVGHSFGAWVAILAAAAYRDIRALVSISSPGQTRNEPSEEAPALYNKLTNSGRVVFDYPSCGALPGFGRISGVVSTIWMRLRGYRARVNWKRALRVGQRLKFVALEQMGDFPKLFVHCGGDTVTTYEKALELYVRSEPPKEFLLCRGGTHATPLFPGSVREKWVAWLVSTLNQTSGK